MLRVEYDLDTAAWGEVHWKFLQRAVRILDLLRQPAQALPEEGPEAPASAPTTSSPPARAPAKQKDGFMRREALKPLGDRRKRIPDDQIPPNQRCKKCGYVYWRKEHIRYCRKGLPVPTEEKPAPVRLRGPSSGGVHLGPSSDRIPDYSEYGPPLPIPLNWTTRNLEGGRVISEPLTSENRHFHVWKLPVEDTADDLPYTLARCGCGDTKVIDTGRNVPEWEVVDPHSPERSPAEQGVGGA